MAKKEHSQKLDLSRIDEIVEWPKNRKSAEIGDAIISNNKIKEFLHWAPRYNLKSGLIRTKEYYENCLEEYLR